MCTTTAGHAQARPAAEFAVRPELRTGEIRELLGLTTNTTIPFLDHLDSIGFTHRDGDYRYPVKGVEPKPR